MHSTRDYETNAESGPSNQREQTERLLARASCDGLEGDVEMADYDDKNPNYGDLKYAQATDSPQERMSDELSVGKGDLLGQEHVDPVLDAKMHLVNNAIDEIGMTTYQWKLFVLNGFGYAVDSLILLIQSIIAGQAAYEFSPGFEYGLTVAAYVGMLVGALFWGLSADVIGRKYAFNISLLLSSVFCIVAGASNSWILLGFFVCMTAFGSGGNLVLDTAVFLEYLPSKDQWLLTLMASWWGVGQLIAGLFAWAYMPNFSCDDPADTGIACGWSNNAGWRYMWFTSGALVLAMSLARVTIIRLRETPKYLVGMGKDAEVVETLQWIAKKYNRPCSLTLERMEACGITEAATGRERRGSVSANASNRFSFGEVGLHLKGLFVTKKLALSTSLIWISWLLIGLAYPLFNVFLPTYLATRGAALGGLSDSARWRNYAIANLCSIPSPILAGFMCRSRIFWGRRGTMIIGALVTMAFFFAYTQVRSNAQNLGFTCAISFCLNIYYGTLYAYTPEVLPSAHRGTGNGISIGLNRIMGIMSAVIATYADTSTPVPIYLCAALYIVMATVAGCFPFEPMGNRSS
ncbi:MFS siderochrome iron transporter 1 [Fulvia fulva]|nr:MFS siderochrome iron transporter 1 [Fulvia fulva]WPV15491.1 MFS siderochrome iron transporter 1 [Fulvia fulva]WPV30297.1 MFS siderochrome iron transporter 1 [Fulvia fulva]